MTKRVYNPTSTYHFVTSPNNPLKPASFTATTMLFPAVLFIFGQSIFLPLTNADVLPSRQNYELPSANLPSMLVGSQPPVDSLLANEPNCSRWIWGQCYYNHGMCGEGKQHATRSGDGCRIIGITSRCYKPCQPQQTYKDPYFEKSPGGVLDDDNYWGVDEKKDSDDDKKKGGGSKSDLPDDMYWPSEDNRNFPYGRESEQTGFVADDNAPLKGLDGASSVDGEHCRWYKASWSECNEDGLKTRVRKLRKNRGADQGLTCPSIKRDTKMCGASTTDDALFSMTADDADSGDMLVKLPAVAPQDMRIDAPCKWDQSVKKCEKCDPKTKEMTCTMPLLSGNPGTCGEERKMQMDC